MLPQGNVGGRQRLHPEGSGTQEGWAGKEAPTVGPLPGRGLGRLEVRASAGGGAAVWPVQLGWARPVVQGSGEAQSSAHTCPRGRGGEGASRVQLPVASPIAPPHCWEEQSWGCHSECPNDTSAGPVSTPEGWECSLVAGFPV